MSLYQLLAQFMRRHWRKYIAAALMLFMVAFLTILIPRQIGKIIDGMVAHQLSGNALIFQLSIILAMGVAIYFLRVGWRLQLFAASYQLSAELRSRLYQRLIVQGPAFFQDQRTGDLMALGTNDADAIELASGEAALAGFDGLMTFFLVIGMMIVGIDWRLALAALLPFPLMALAFKRITHHIHDASKESLERFSNLNDHVQETISGVRTLRALGLEEKVAKDFSTLTDHAASASLRAQRWEAAYEPAVGLTLTAASGITLAFGGYLVWQGEMSVGELTAFSMYLGQLIWPMFAAGWVLSLLERGKAAWSRLRSVLEEHLTIQDLGDNCETPQASLVFNNISFAYQGQIKPALNKINFSLEAGKTLGIVGPTGSGKSSILRLILRQFEAQQGTIHWGENLLSSFSLDTLRKSLNWVAQEPFLFSASIARNIALSNPNASDEQIMHAAKLAAVHDDIMRFPQAYDTLVGERGVTLSGGQKQRVAIARALLTDCSLLLLDDALSAVDTDTETRILQHLSDLRKNQNEQHNVQNNVQHNEQNSKQNSKKLTKRSTVIVSHRLSAVVDADHIIVMRDGCIVEQGTHASLLAQDKWYASQWKYQQLEASL